MQIINQTLVSPTISDTPTNHIIVVDCSGSMYSELPKIRTHLKNKIPTMVKYGDTLSIIWFSGRNQFGVLFEGAEVHGLLDLTNINSTIDRYLTTVGMTGFKQPLEEVLAVIKRLRTHQHSMIFCSDGYDNEWNKKDIIKACTDLSTELVSSCFVEYGWNADRETLLEMAEEVGGSLVHATDFSKYAFQLDNIKNLSYGKRITVSVPTKSLASGCEFVVGHTPSGFVIAKPVNDTVSLPSSTQSFSYITGNGKAITKIADDVTACGVAAALVQRGQADLALDTIALIGDVDLHRTMSNAFSKQDYTKVVEQAEAMATGKQRLFVTAPKSNSLTVDPNAYSVLQLLMDLANNDGNKLVISHPDFNYQLIGKKRETEEVDGFTPTFTDLNVGGTVADISNLTFDGDRPNISILTKRLGTVSLPDNDYGFGNSFNSFIWRNYAIVRDGIVNVDKLPVTLTKSTYDLLVVKGLQLESYKVGKVFTLDVSKLPVINRAMVNNTKAETLFKYCLEEYALECQQKYVKTLITKAEVGTVFTNQYGEDAAKFLKKYGITEGGFSPKTVASDEVSDKYIAKVLKVKLAGLSSVPKPDDVKAAITKGKSLTVSQQIMSEAMTRCDNIIATGTTPEELVVVIKQGLKSLRAEMVKMKFGVIIGRKWFSDLAGYEDTVREIDSGFGKKVKCEVVLSDILV